MGKLTSEQVERTNSNGECIGMWRDLMGRGYTKKEIIARQLKLLKGQATRHLARSNKQKDLICDLKLIEEMLEQLEEMMKSAKEDYYI